MNLQLLDWMSVALSYPSLISHLLPHSLVLDLLTTWCRDAAVQLTPRRVVSNQPGQCARPVSWAREGTQPPLSSATDWAIGLASVQVGSWGFSPWHFNVVTACICPQYKCMCSARTQRRKMSYLHATVLGHSCFPKVLLKVISQCCKPSITGNYIWPGNVP